MCFMFLDKVKKKQRAWKDLMVKATDQLMETSNKQVFYGQQKG